MYQSYKAKLDKMSGSDTKLKIVMFLGTVREGRLATRVSKFIQDQLKGKYEITVLDPEELDLPLLKKPFYFYQDPSEAPAKLRECDAKIKAADAFIIVTAEYNHSIPPALSNLLDHFASSAAPVAGAYTFRPSGIVCYSYGIYGGMRAAMQLRAMLSELGTMSVPSIFGIPEAFKALDENGKPLNDHMVTGLNQMVSQLDWYAHAMKSQREKVGLPK